MKLRYKNIVIGNLSDLSFDMYREEGKLELLTVQQRESSRLSNQLFMWIETNSRLEELELELDDEEYNDNLEVEMLWNQNSKLPNFINDDNWNLFYDESGKIEMIDCPRFCYGRAAYSLRPKFSEEKKREKDYSSFIGILIGIILLIIWFFIKY